MRKAIFMMLLMATMSNSAMAEWTNVGSTSNFTAYANLSSIRKAGSRVKMWSMDDYKTIRTDGYVSFISRKQLNEYDCKEEQARILGLSYHSENMGEGSVPYKNSDRGNWSPVTPDSVSEVLWKIACGKK